MKVVLFCGGKGLRMREASSTIPKPMIGIGGRPVLWHVMKYFAHHGHTDFILCLGYQQEVIKDYFLNYRETMSNDFVLSGGGSDVRLLAEDISDWRISFINTGHDANVGERLRRVREHIGDDEYFLANYGDVLTDAPLNTMVDDFVGSDKVVSFLSVPPRYTFHTVSVADDGRTVSAVRDVADSEIWVNGGYFAIRRDIFDYMEPGEELVTDVFSKLVPRGLVATHRHRGFWAPMDTLKEQQELEAMVDAGGGPWRLWEKAAAHEPESNGRSPAAAVTA
ncbi:MAG: sugar phosphate nucleotidyltransferase [Thermoleophilia bacterium]